jgi:hypothetical protein
MNKSISEEKNQNETIQLTNTSRHRKKIVYLKGFEFY